MLGAPFPTVPTMPTMRPAVLLLALAATPAFAAPADPTACLDAKFAAMPLDLEAAGGLSVAILPMDAAWAWSAARGVADRGSGEALTPAHGFRIASNTKTYTAAAVMRLVEQGRLRLEDAIADHLPAEFIALLEKGGYDPRAITLRHLLTHTSGMREHVNEEFLRRHARDDGPVSTPAEQLELAMEAGPPLAPPGTEFHYSDTGYVLLGTIIERTTGQPLYAALRSLQRWDGQGLSHTWFETLEPARGPQAHQYWKGADTRGWHPSFDLYGGGGIVATPSDMAGFTRVLLRGALFESSASLQAMKTPGVEGAWNAYGAGLFELPVGDETMTGHSGFWNTFSFLSRPDGVVIAGAVLEQTALPYPALIGELRAAYRACAVNQVE